jgi:serine/threonine-protein kinase
MSNLIGRTLGGYEVVKKIGEGGNSDVYLARDKANQRLVALKVLRLEHHDDPAKVERFWIGGQSARALQHAHIVPVYEAGLANSRYFIAMQYMQGRSIEDLLAEQNGPLPWPVALDYLEQIAGAIDYAHSRGVIHRDIKPSNILLSADRRSACLTDFGIARLTGQETITEQGSLVGTPEYMSPEQAKGQTVDKPSDIYSLGVTAYQMLSGALPYDGPPVTMLYNHIHTPPPSIRRANPQLPRGFVRPIEKALAKEPERRQATAGALAQELRLASVPARPNGALWGALALVALVIVALAFLFRPGPPAGSATTPRPQAEPTPVVGGVPTSTTAPTSRPTSTARPDPTATVIEVVNVRDTSTPRPITTRTPTPTPAPPRLTRPHLVAPSDGSELQRNAAIQLFHWEWDRALAEDESFELRFYPEDSDEYLAPFGWRKQNIADIDLNNLPAGSYVWLVAVVRGRDGNWEEDVATSETYHLTWGR